MKVRAKQDLCEFVDEDCKTKGPYNKGDVFDIVGTHTYDVLHDVGAIEKVE